ncbi:lymphatic vessel endothelial hyaluronic acid receptor 1a isoform X1 [Electrophorus electricus]|uniref:Link domain-containing protein n=1 Tax=Electrophorus electricus TaxID=8005 RepID=A0A4W4G0Z7_ELEEL|nr:lymphatic vessel endothelial hyaluronic acid receptor 1a isoform X1 [Electrophorus electricus]
MARITMLFLLLIHLITPALLIETDQITVYPGNGTIYGVFHVALRGAYAFNASVARSVCQQLSVTIADKAQVAGALQHGFETCRFGWINEQVAVIPRIEQKVNCGQGKVGVITWRAPLTTEFDVFCFNLTDFEVQAEMTATHVQQNTTYASRSSGVLPETAPPASESPLWSATPCPSCSPSSPQDLEDEASGPSLTLGVVPAAFLIIAVFAVLLAAVAAFWRFKTSPLSSGEQKECIEAQVHDSCSRKNAEEPQSKVQNHSVENVTEVRVTSGSKGGKAS